MSETVTEFFEAAAKTADEWLLKLGIDVPALRQRAQQPGAPLGKPGMANASERPGEASKPPPVKPPVPAADPDDEDYERALKKYRIADEQLRRAERILASTQRQNSALPGRRSAYDELPGLPADPAGTAELDASLKEAEKKLVMAKAVIAADSAELAADFAAGRKLRERERPELAEYLAKSGETHQANVDGARRAMTDALTLGDYTAANKAAETLKTRAGVLAAPYALAVDADRNKPLFDRAALLLAQDELPPELQALQPAYAAAVKKHEDLAKTGPQSAWSASLKDRIKKAQAIVAAAGKSKAIAWFDDGMAAPAGAEPTDAEARPAGAAGGDGLASGLAALFSDAMAALAGGQPKDAARGDGFASGLTTLPDFATMDETAKVAAVQRTVAKGVNLKARVIAKYGEVLGNGTNLDLTPAQVAGLLAYSMSSYATVNKVLRGSSLAGMPPEAVDDARIVAELTAQALEQLPKYPAGAFPLFRLETPYGPYMETRYKEGVEFEVKEFWSTGGGCGANVNGGSLEIVIWGKADSRAKDISMLSNAGKGEGSREDGAVLKGQAAGEVLFPAGTRFRTVKFDVFDADGKNQVQRLRPDGSKVGGGSRYRAEIVEI